MSPVEVEAVERHEPTTAWFLDRVSDVALGGDTGQAVMVERSASVRGLMTPLHVRDEAEIYRILEGSVTFFIGRGPFLPAPAKWWSSRPSGPERCAWIRTKHAGLSLRASRHPPTTRTSVAHWRFRTAARRGRARKRRISRRSVRRT